VNEPVESPDAHICCPNFLYKFILAGLIDQFIGRPTIPDLAFIKTNICEKRLSIGKAHQGAYLWAGEGKQCIATTDYLYTSYIRREMLHGHHEDLNFAVLGIAGQRDCGDQFGSEERVGWSIEVKPILWLNFCAIFPGFPK
jgi:hypothetical protein